VDQNTKQRLVGLTVIFALAVIFLPMILDGSGIRQNTLEVEIPPQPVSKFKPEFEQKIVELNDRVEELPNLEPRVADEDSSSNQIARLENQDSDDAVKIPETEQKVAEEAVTEQPVAMTGGDTWVLQVASFKDKPKALVQRDNLRKSNIAAVFVEQFKIDDQVIYRVRLGPFVDREKAKIALNKLKAKHDINGLIMQYEK
jgi:DedD protein